MTQRHGTNPGRPVNLMLHSTAVTANMAVTAFFKMTQPSKKEPESRCSKSKSNLLLADFILESKRHSSPNFIQQNPFLHMYVRVGCSVQTLMDEALG